jgi:hypothetical protein
MSGSMAARWWRVMVGWVWAMMTSWTQLVTTRTGMASTTWVEDGIDVGSGVVWARGRRGVWGTNVRAATAGRRVRRTVV